MMARDPSHLRQAIDAEIKSLEESIRELKHRRNALAPISSLPTEAITTIFSFLHIPVTSSAFTLDKQPNLDRRAWLRVAHVCHQWREIALNQPLFWSHVDFTIFSSAGTAGILSRAKTVPLQLEARVPYRLWGNARLSAFQKELQDRVSHVSHLAISAEPFQLRKILNGLASPAPTLKCLSLSSVEYHARTILDQVDVLDTLFDGSTPRLSGLELCNCDISWDLLLLRGLKHLDIRTPIERPSLSVWLDALEQMPQLKTLILHLASPIAPPGDSLPHDVYRAVTLPSITLFGISSPARDCGLALAHLILPALASLYLVAESCCQDGSDVQEILSYVVPHAHGPQDTQPLQSMCVSRCDMFGEIFVWAFPDIDVELLNEQAFLDTAYSARVAFSVKNRYWSRSPEVGMATFDAVMEALPLDGLVTLTAQNRIRPLTEQFWLRHAHKWPLVRCVRLTQPAERGFREMVLEDNGGRDSPLFLLLTKLVLVENALFERRTLRLCDTFMKRVEQGVPLEVLDLTTCFATGRSVELLSEIVVDVLRPEKTYEPQYEVESQSVPTFVISGLNLEDESDDNYGYEGEVV
ncbi:hypothetical protein EDB85DRAFT_2108767 [Lactarius pseudohatsudake]|nr:hypothetical protein EDB85DRAFT_2108767 [Lactarius pseudohatsudake]